jgi:hypothetical protein
MMLCMLIGNLQSSSGDANVSGAQMVFSSSCTVYGNPEYTPLDEKHRLQVGIRVCDDLFAGVSIWRRKEHSAKV